MLGRIFRLYNSSLQYRHNEFAKLQRSSISWLKAGANEVRYELFRKHLGIFNQNVRCNDCSN